MANNEYYLPLIISLTPIEIRHHYDVDASQPAHDLVVRVLLNNCKEAYVYGLKKESPLYQENSDILQASKGKFNIDITKECLKGHEKLWNVTGWERGSIVLILEDNKFDFHSIFPHCYRPGLSATPNSGNTLSAIKKCKEEAKNNNIGICFPASNGIEWIQIYANPELTERLVSDALRLCKDDYQM